MYGAENVRDATIPNEDDVIMLYPVELIGNTEESDFLLSLYLKTEENQILTATISANHLQYQDDIKYNVKSYVLTMVCYFSNKAQNLKQGSEFKTLGANLG